MVFVRCQCCALYLICFLPLLLSIKRLLRNMGNCQAIDNASLMIQHPCGKVDKLYSPVSATQIMNLNPGHQVALLLTSSLYTCSSSSSENTPPIRVTRIKLLKPSDTLVLGHIYRLVTTQEVTRAKKKHAAGRESSSSELEEASVVQMANEMKNAQEQERVRRPTNYEQQQLSRSRAGAWQPSLHTISESETS